MQRFRTAAVLTAAIVVGTPSPSQAEDIVTGSYAAGQSVYRDGSLTLGPGRYRFRLSFTGGVGSVDGSVTNLRVSSYFCDFGDGNGEVYCGGDDVPIDPLLEPVGPNLYGASLTVEPPSTLLLPGGPTTRIDEFDLCCTYRFAFDASEAGSFVFSYAAVPEPAAWALMIAGFAGVGAALRRRRAQVAFG